MNSKSKKGPAGARKRRSSDVVHAGSGNVFADIGLPDAQSRLAKAELAHQIALLIGAAGLSQRGAAERLGIDQPKISALLHGRLKDFSTERLMKFITALDRDVIITVREPEDQDHPALRVLVKA